MGQKRLGENRWVKKVWVKTDGSKKVWVKTDGSKKSGWKLCKNDGGDG